MQDIINRVRTLPEEDRWKIAVISAAIAAVVLLVLWLLFLPLQFKGISVEEQQETETADATVSPKGLLGRVFGSSISVIQRGMRGFAAQLEQEAVEKETNKEASVNEAGVEPTHLPR